MIWFFLAFKFDVKLDIYIRKLYKCKCAKIQIQIRCHLWDLHLPLYQINQQVIHFPVPCQIKAHGSIVPCRVQYLVVAPGFNCFIRGTGDAVILGVIWLKLGTCTIQYKFIFFSCKDILWITMEVYIELHYIQYTCLPHHTINCCTTTVQWSVC